VYSDELLRPWFESVLGLVPGTRLFDAHTHTGANDPDGYRCSADQLVEGLELAGARAVVFTSADPSGYRAANDRVIAEAAASDGRLVAFARLDPADEPLAEAERSLSSGARGIKLHPRAERFRLADERLEPVFALASERRLPVIVHAGRGIPALGRDALALTERHPGMRLILAHDGVCDLAWIWRHAADHPNLFFDTSWWHPLDHLTLFRLVPPGQILFASDMPYGTTLMGTILDFRAALQVGLAPEQIRCIAGEQLERLLACEEPIDAGPAPGAQELTVDVITQRMASYLVAAISRMFIGEAGGDYIGLARLACEVGDDAEDAPVARSVLALLDRAEEYTRRAGFQPRPPGDTGPRLPHPAVAIAVTAAMVAMTPDVPVPELGDDDVEVAEREP
jgi:predicted TIM-barrel fold metal-dependent hydrolase